MKKILSVVLALVIAMACLTGCDESGVIVELMERAAQELESYDAVGYDDETDADYDDKTVDETSDGADFGERDVSEKALAYAESVVEEDGVYTTPALVAAYIHTFNKLPSNYITKKEAQQLGWDSQKGNLGDVAPGKSIGGDSFGNREGLLPKGKYRECDVNYKSGRRGSERLIYSGGGDVYYTGDHYGSFTQLY